MSVHIPSHLQDAETELLAAWSRIAELEAELTKARADQKADRKEAADWREEWRTATLKERDRLKAALRPFAFLAKLEQVKTAVIAEDDLITVVVRASDIENAKRIFTP